MPKMLGYQFTNTIWPESKQQSKIGTKLLQKVTKVILSTASDHFRPTLDH